MNSLRGRRVIIASLFLPNAAVLGDSVQNQQKPKPASRITSSSGSGPLKSIVDDLKVKTQSPTPAIRSPTQESSNPFAKFNTDVSTPSPPQTRKHQTTRTSISTDLRRRQSRSSSRRVPESPSNKDSWHIEPNPQCNGGLKNAIDSVSDKLKKKLWVGTLGTNTDSFSEYMRSNIESSMMLQNSSLPVWIPDAEFEGCYDEFCHQVLWPCLHYAIPDAPKTKFFYESASYSQYVAVNKRFADAIISCYQEGDIVWVNDYHLMLVPHLLRSSPNIPQSAPIGFFMHVAFPSSEIFRCLSVRQDLLRGLLGADLVGFQTANYARHFRQTVSRIMAYEALPKGIEVPEGEEGVDRATGKGKNGKETRSRFVDVGVFPMGIDVRALKEKRADPEVKDWVQVLTQRYAGMKIVVGRDKLDEVQGVRHKIQAFEYFLDKYPSFQGKAVLIQVALQTTESNEIAGGVADVVSRVNSRFSTLTYQPVVFLHTQDLTFTQYLALLSVADAFIVTSLREGMALRTHEYVECQEGKCRPLVLSEFTGSYSYSGFRSCIAINPWDTRGTAAAINQALTMSDQEASIRWEELHNHVITQTAQAFVTTFLNRCIRAHSEHMHDQDAESGDIPMLDVSRVLPKYRYSMKRLIFVDFEGTLWIRDLSREGLMRMLEDENGDAPAPNADGIIKKNTKIGPPEDMLNTLEKLVEDRRNEVWLLSGLRVKGVLERVAERLPGMGIVAENGCFIKTIKARSSTSPHGDWINMVASFNLTWKSACLEILNYFTERTPGSFVEEREASMVWRFWTGQGPDSECADRQWARRQAAEAQNHIFDSLGERYGLRIIPGKNSFLVLPNNISRASAVNAILHPGGPTQHQHPLSGRTAWISSELEGPGNRGTELDFLMAMSGDEKLLRRLNEFDAAETCCTIGGRARGTDARWRVETGKVGEVLAIFAGVADA